MSFLRLPPSVQASAYQITLDRTVGEHKLPENCIVIAAGNRVTDKSVAFHMPKALANRLCHIEVKGDADSWYEWAYAKGINHMVIGYLRANPSFLMGFDTDSDSLAFPTPRSWEMVSELLNVTNSSPKDILPLIKGCIGDDIATDFCMWIEIYSKIPSIKDILLGSATTVPSRPEALFALVGDITAAAHKAKTETEIKNIVEYVSCFPQEFRHVLFSDLLKISFIRPALKKCSAYCDWFEETEQYWEDYGL